MTHYTNAHQNAVAAMHEAFGHPVEELPTLADEDTRKLRLKLIREELKELDDALAAGDIIEVADALGDLLVVVHGSGCAFGVDTGLVFDEVMRSNMTKLDADGKPVPHPEIPGKFGKSDLYEPPRIAAVFARQIAEARA